MGEVHLAHDPRLDRNVALKILSSNLAQRPEFRERFLLEARSISGLNHPNITTVHEIGEADGLHYIAFEYVDGPTLESMLGGQKGLPTEELLTLALPLAEALEYAHGKGVVHRDLKPANILVSELGIPKILDFGLAKVLPDVSGGIQSDASTVARLTQAGVVVGTISYMSPEQALGKPVDARSDIFSFGGLLYEMASGRRAFTGGNPPQVLENLLHKEPVALERLRPDVPGEMRRIVSKALRKDPSERYQSMGGLAADLRHIIRESGSKPRDSVPGEHRARSVLELNWRWFSAALLVAVILVVAGTEWYVDRPSTTPGSLAVMYFENVGAPDDSAHTGRMLSSLLTSELSGSDGLQIVSQQRLHDVAKRLGREAGLVDRSVATHVAREAGVETMVLGKVVRVGDRVVATTELVDVSTGRSLSSQRTEGQSVEDVFKMAEDLGRQVLSELARSSRHSELTLASDSLTKNLTASVDAYRAYVRGESLLQRADFESALDEFQEAIRIDPEFAMAHFRRSIAARWLSDGVMAHQAARNAVAKIENAPTAYREVIRANALYQEGAYSQAIPLLEAVLEVDPNLKEGLYLLSQIYVHSSRDHDSRRAIDLMERLLTLDPEFYLVYDRLALTYGFRGDMEMARTRLDEWESIRPEKVQGLRSVLSTLEGQPEEALGFSQAFSWLEGPLFMTSAAMLASRWDIAGRLAEYDPDDWKADHLRAWSFRNRGTFHTYVGAWDQAVTEYRQAGRVSGLRVHEGETGGVPASALQSLAELLDLQGDAGGARREAEQALALQPESARGLYYAGKYSLRDDDLDAAEQYLQTLELLPAASTSDSIQMYQSALRAEIALFQGDFDLAASILQRVVTKSLVIDWPTTCSSAGAAFRDSLARAYSAAGLAERGESVLEELTASGFERVDHPVLYVRALYSIGVTKLERGEPVGRRYVEKFLEHWGDADWEIPEIEDAKARLSSISGHWK